MLTLNLSHNRLKAGCLKEIFRINSNKQLTLFLNNNCIKTNELNDLGINLLNKTRMYRDFIADIFEIILENPIFEIKEKPISNAPYLDFVKSSPDRL